MPRIIAGKAKGMRLHTPRGSGTRPTSDRVKEALFSIIGPRVVGARVLDVYAGTGALGIEAWSRGARQSVFVERAPEALACLRRNITKARMEAAASVLSSRTLPSRLGADPFDLVFADPPYEKGHLSGLFRWLEQDVPLRSGTLLVVEGSGKEDIPADLKKFLFNQERQYGRTTLTFFTVT